MMELIVGLLYVLGAVNMQFLTTKILTMRGKQVDPFATVFACATWPAWALFSIYIVWREGGETDVSDNKE